MAEMAAETTYREFARILNEWTAVSISHTTVGNIVKKVGKAQKEADEELVKELEESAELPKRKEVDFLYAEADGVFVRGTEKKKSHEVHNASLAALEHRDVSEARRQAMRIEGAVNDIYMLQLYTNDYYKELQRDLQAQIRFVIWTEIIGSIALIVMSGGITRSITNHCKV